MKIFAHVLALASAFSVVSPALALDSIPLEQLQPGLWKVERKMEKLDLNPVEYETRNTEYCASPKKEIARVLSVTNLLCKTEDSKVGENRYQIHAKCNLFGIVGENTTIITIVSPSEYTAEVETIGTKFGKKQHRKELITAKRAGDC
ncbi:MAG TPA: DUF3617 family protein [Casimicrobium sp.]|nr:DUF3617 family protein [Casimicrobium sp.]